LPGRSRRAHSGASACGGSGRSPWVASDPQVQARYAAFLQGLQQLGWSVGNNVQIDSPWSAGNDGSNRTDIVTIPSAPMRYASLIGLLCAGLLLNGSADAQGPGGGVRIGILNDQSGPYADFGGKTSVDAARMAVEEMGGKVLGKSIEIIVGDHQNKPDIASALVRRWFDVDGVSAVAELTNSAVALAVQQIAKEEGGIRFDTGPGTTRLTNEELS